MRAEIGFKRALASDREFLLALRKSTMNEHLLRANINLTDEQHMMRIDEHFDDSFLILFNGEPIGLIKLGVLTDRLHIRQLQILNEFCNIGIGSKVLSLIKEKAKQRSLPITLNVLLENPAKRLYQREGFVIEGQNDIEYQMRWVEGC